jgi:hypothetical protein
VLSLHFSNSRTRKVSAACVATVEFSHVIGLDDTDFHAEESRVVSSEVLYVQVVRLVIRRCILQYLFLAQFLSSSLIALLRSLEMCDVARCQDLSSQTCHADLYDIKLLAMETGLSVPWFTDMEEDTSKNKSVCIA